MRRGIGCGLALLLCTVAAAEERDTRLHFARNGEPLRSLDLEALRAGCTPRRIEVDDPYYARRKTFLACPLHEVLALGFGAALEADANVNVFLRARDGYTRDRKSVV